MTNTLTAAGPREFKRLTRRGRHRKFKLQPRDCFILEQIARFRWLTSEQIAWRCGGSAAHIARRLHLMWEAKLLARPESQLARLIGHAFHGQPHLVYGLSRKGADLLTERGFDLTHRLDWTFRPGIAPNLDHTLKVADVMLRFHVAVAGSPGLEIRDHADLLPDFPDQTRAARRPFRLPVAFTHTYTVIRRNKTTGNDEQHEVSKELSLAAVPDRLFTIEADEGEGHVFALEYESGENTIRSRSFAKSSWFRKCLAFYQAVRQGKHTELWNYDRLRVLCVVGTGPDRIDKMIEAQRQATAGHYDGLFLYTTLDRLKAEGPLSAIWRSSTADNLALLATPTAAATQLNVNHQTA